MPDKKMSTHEALVTAFAAVVMISIFLKVIFF
jgi:hypothetical protein